MLKARKTSAKKKGVDGYTTPEVKRSSERGE